MNIKMIGMLLFLGLMVACASPAVGDTAVTATTSLTQPTTSPATTEAAPSDTAVTPTEADRPDGWATASHSNEADPDYDTVFPDDEVKQMIITIAPEDWQAMQADMVELYGEPGQENGRFGGPSGGEGGRPFQDGQPPEGFEMPEDFVPGQGGQPPEGFEMPEGFQPPGGIGGGFGMGESTENPIWVEATIEFDGNVWTHVGVRYKGNSSLRGFWNAGSLKLPFKMDFDQFEDDYPEIHNQRFYGFKQLSFANGFGDETFMRDALTYDLLDQAGLPAAETAFYELIVDYGEGQTSLGVYTLIEVIDDTVIEREFDGDSGNIYEGEGSGATLAAGTVEQIVDSFQKENNKDEADWSDIEALYHLLHAEERTTDPELWQSELEAIFDVDSFLKWLALSAILQHWDTYGSMSHNFYLYNNPATNQLTWVSWDHNLILGASPNGGFGGQMPNNAASDSQATGQGSGPRGQGGFGPGGNGRNNVSFDKADVSEQWPLIRYILDQPVYYQQYLAYLAEMGELFDADALAQQYATWQALLADYAAADIGADAFNTAVADLVERTHQQDQAVEQFLSSQ